MSIDKERERIIRLPVTQLNIELAEVAGWTEIEYHRKYSWRGKDPLTDKIARIPKYTDNSETLVQFILQTGEKYPDLYPVITYNPSNHLWYVVLIDKSQEPQRQSESGDLLLGKAYARAFLIMKYALENGESA